jgi:branched-chain amino acid transport system permease protein
MDSMTAVYIAQGLHGLAYGMLLFLVASGLTLIFGMMGILNLAHASFFMLSSYFCYQVVQMTGSFWMGLLIAPLATAVVGVLVERLMLRRLRAFGHVGELLVTVGLMLIILESVQYFWGTESLPLPPPEMLEGMVSIAGINYPIYRLFVIGMSLLVLIILFLILFKTRLGMIVRAAVNDADMVNALGINIPLVFSLVFAAGTWMAGIAGVAIAPIITVFPGLADQIGMDAFLVVITGGFGSLGGAFLVSLIFGFLTSYGIQFVSTLAPVLMFIFMAIVLIIKPMGLFGERE